MPGVVDQKSLAKWLMTFPTVGNQGLGEWGR
jgi:hypothetical protein